MLLHAADAKQKGCKKLLVRTVDTDVVVIAISVMNDIKPEELWVAFGVGKNLRYIPIHSIAASIGPRKSAALPFFHSFTGCDTVSSFTGIGKKTAWNVWNVYPEATEAFEELVTMPDNISHKSIALMQRFVVLLYC